jgi:hypothetical protein
MKLARPGNMSHSGIKPRRPNPLKSGAHLFKPLQAGSGGGSGDKR